MKMIKQTYLINASIEKVWEALTEPEIIKEWGGGPSKMSENEGEKFEFWGGDIYGSNIKIIKYKLIEQDWYGGDWEAPSKVRFELSEKNGKTQIVLTHTNLPAGEEYEFEEGWKKYYLGPLKDLLEK
jgi:uncharacterized protein YndB with AHSA1/START domain